MGLPLFACRKVTELDKTKSMASIKKEFIDRITDRQRRDGSDLLDVITSFTGKPKREGSARISHEGSEDGLCRSHNIG